MSVKPLILLLLPLALFAADLSKEVRHELVMLPYYGVFDNLAYRVDGSKVTLFGQVRDPKLKSDAEKAVKTIEGVQSVDNQIEVLPLSNRSEEHTSELQSHVNLVCRLLLEKKKKRKIQKNIRPKTTQT